MSLMLSTLFSVLSTNSNNFLSSQSLCVDKLGRVLPLITDFELLMLAGLASAPPQIVTGGLFDKILKNWKGWKRRVGNKRSSAHQMEWTAKMYTWNHTLLYGVWIPVSFFAFHSSLQTAFLQGYFAIKLGLPWHKQRPKSWGKRR